VNTQAVTASCYRNQYPYIESVSGYGLKQRGVCRNFKNEDTWYRVPWHYDAEFDSIPRGTPAVCSRGGGTGGTLYNSSQPERQPLRPVLVLEWWQVELELQLARQRSWCR
jgi:hypothetical protein